MNFMSETTYVKQETFEQMKAELQHMKGIQRPAASRAIAEAREKGDLKENAEYDAAKEAQGMLEANVIDHEISIITPSAKDVLASVVSKANDGLAFLASYQTPKRYPIFLVTQESKGRLIADKFPHLVALRYFPPFFLRY